MGRSARAEREFRCDDRAVDAGGCAATYVRLLAGLEANRSRTIQLAPSLADSLAARCARLLGRQRRTWSRGLLAVAAILTLAGAAAAHAVAVNKPPPKAKLLWCGCTMDPN
jgi:hypothetical protein